ncbi:MAG: putative system histidine kinase, partial [Pseudomonadota bacterium]
MALDDVSLIGWGYGLAAAAYAVLALHLLRQLFDQRPTDRTRLAVLAAATLTALWAGLSVWAGTSDAGSAWWLLGGVLDTLRYAAWFGFVVL